MLKILDIELNPIGIISDYEKFTLTKENGAVGSFSFTCSYKEYYSLIKCNNVVYYDANVCGIIETFKYDIEKGTIQVSGVSAVALLDRFGPCSWDEPGSGVTSYSKFGTYEVPWGGKIAPASNDHDGVINRSDLVDTICSVINDYPSLNTYTSHLHATNLINAAEATFTDTVALYRGGSWLSLIHEVNSNNSFFDEATATWYQDSIIQVDVLPDVHTRVWEVMFRIKRQTHTITTGINNISKRTYLESIKDSVQSLHACFTSPYRVLNNNTAFRTPYYYSPLFCSLDSNNLITFANRSRVAPNHWYNKRGLYEITPVDRWNNDQAVTDWDGIQSSVPLISLWEKKSPELCQKIIQYSCIISDVDAYLGDLIYFTDKEFNIENEETYVNKIQYIVQGNSRIGYVLSTIVDLSIEFKEV